MDTVPTPVTNTPTSTPAVASTPATTLTDAQLAKQKQASWGAIIVILLILAMIVVGAFYAWGHRIAQGQTPAASGTAQ